ncbi:MAG TPA: hypothetical protein VLA93_20010 [Pyrinomonadaceae bacterium]|nr:hypothetical protein [Pyrinomonadaceae bacterium]
MNFHLFESLPLWAIFIGIVLIVLLSAGLGIYLARSRKRRLKSEEDAGPIGMAGSATLGLLAFILAFTFGLTASRFDSRKQLFLDEVTAIETTAMRSDLIPEPHRTEVRELLHKYIELRLNFPQTKEAALERVKQSEEVQRQLWPHAAALADSDLKNADIVSLFVDSVNQMINLQTRRITIGSQHIPLLVWFVLFGVMILSMIEVGYLFGRSQNVNWLFLVALSLAFSAVMVLIADLDRSGAGTTSAITVNQQPLIDMHRRLYGDHAK